MNRLPPAKFYLDYLHADAGVEVCIVRYGVGAYTVKHGVGACIVRHGVSKYSGRKITESLGNVTVRGGKRWKSKGGARLSTVCLKTFTTHSCPPLRFFCSLNLNVSHCIIQGNDYVFSPSVLSSFGLPLPSTCLVLTVSEARSYFASAIHSKVCSCSIHSEAW
jgi:hypothetical protein